MMEFKVGDRVRFNNEEYSPCPKGGFGTVKKALFGGGVRVLPDNQKDDHAWLYTSRDIAAGKLDLVSEEGASMARKTFKLKKDTPTVRKGAIFQEACDDGTQEYIVLTPELIRDSRGKSAIFDRSLVEEQPTWFEEVFAVEPQYMTREELDRWEAFKTSKKTLPATAVAKVSKKRTWTDAQRAAHGAKIKAAYRRKKAAATRAA